MALAERAAEHGITLIRMGRPEFDLAAADKSLNLIEEAKPDVIVSAAAYTAVDKAETDTQNARAINADGPAALGRLAADLAVPLVHLSTDYVFDGTKTTPYLEDDGPNPLGVYGATKLAGERAIAAATANHAILRTAWVYSPFGANFLKNMLRVGAERAELRIVDDQIGNPTSALDLADAIIKVGSNLVRKPDEQSLRGIFHVTGNGEASWADFASAIFKTSADLGGPSPAVRRIPSADYPTPARRPINSRLSNDKLKQRHGVVLPHWHSSMHSTVRRLLGDSLVPRQNSSSE
jgi:dTDP-4-dehydrorhamnose reductase